MDSNAFGGSLMLVAVIFGIVLLVCWIVLPFAVIGTKGLLRELLQEQRRTNELLAQLAGERRPPTP